MKLARRIIIGFLILLLISFILSYIDYLKIMRGGTSNVQPVSPPTSVNK